MPGNKLDKPWALNHNSPKPLAPNPQTVSFKLCLRQSCYVLLDSSWDAPHKIHKFSWLTYKAQVIWAAGSQDHVPSHLILLEP